MNDTIVAWFLLGGIAFWALVEWARAADRNVEAAINAALADQASDFDEPTRNDVEAGWLNEDTEDWLFESPEFKTAEPDRAAAVLFAASVMADIDDLPGGDAV